MKQELQKIGGLEFIYTSGTISKTIDYEYLSKFIKEEFLKNKLESEEKNEDILKKSDKLEKLKLDAKKKESEYLIRQKQVTTYLECKKSFFGRIRYYFKGKNKLKAIKENNTEQNEEEKEYIDKSDLIYSEKEYYTIEDLIDITKILERIEKQIRNIELDMTALEEKIARLTKRINNAKSYIEEIEEHKKSFFEFLRFVNDDAVLRIKRRRNRRRETCAKANRKKF